MASHAEYEEIFAEVEAPFAFVDLDAMWSNAEEMLGRAEPKPVRVASKSIRCSALLDRILDREERFAGLMTFTLPETSARRGSEPAARLPDRRHGALGELRCVRSPARRRRRSQMVDCASTSRRSKPVLGAGAAPVRVCIDLDALLVGAWRRTGGRAGAPRHARSAGGPLAREIRAAPAA